MPLSSFGGLAPRLFFLATKGPANLPFRPANSRIWGRLQTRSQHNSKAPRPIQRPRQSAEPQAIKSPTGNQIKYEEAALPQNVRLEDVKWPNVKVRYLRPAIWALVVSGGIFTGLAYLQAKQEVKKTKSQGWLKAPQWGTQSRGPPTPTQLATQWWTQLNPVSKLSCGIIAANSAVHLSSFLVPQYWDLLWHIPARNVNYTLLTSAFVHSGPFHLFVNMYATYNFMLPVGYSRAFEGNPYSILSFFLATGVLSGFAQHWATLITPQKRAVPEMFIRCGGASGALLGILGVFCMEYPHAGLGIILLPFHFEAQYVLPAIMLFDFVGMVRGYSFVNFGHAASHGASGTINIC
jgi:rhomboid-like protein